MIKRLALILTVGIFYFPVALSAVASAVPPAKNTQVFAQPGLPGLGDDTKYYQANGCATASGPGTGAATAISLSVSAAQQAAQAVSGATKTGFAVYDSAGKLLASFNSGFQNYGASITKSMLLVAYLKQVGSGSLTAEAKSQLTNMIENSDNDAANWVYRHLSNGPAQVKAVASDAGMSSFQLDTSDPVYVLGQSQISADDFAKFFAKIDTYMPGAQKDFGMNLLSNLSPADQQGLLQAGLPGTVYSKEGWKSEPAGSEGAPYIVNQAAQFTADGTTYGLAVLVGGTTDQSAGESLIKSIVSALFQQASTGGTPSGTSCCSTSTGTGTSTAPSGPTTLTGNSNEEKIYNYFIAKGLTPVQAAGIDGNFGQESGWSPTDPGGYLAQWGGDRFTNLNDFAAQQKKPVTDLGLQLDFVWKELNGPYASVLKNLKAATSIDGVNGSVNQFMGPNNLAGSPISPTDPSQRSGGYEDPGIPDGQNRIDYANQALHRYGGGATSGGSSGSCGSTATGSPDCTSAAGDTKILCEAKKYDPVSYQESALGNHFSGGNPQWLKTCPKIGPSCYLDCSGLVNIAVYDAFGYNLEENTSSEASDTTLWKHISFNQVQAGDLIQPAAYAGNHVEIIDHVGGNTVYTFGAHTSSYPQPQQVSPTTITHKSGDVFLHWIGPGGS